MKIRGSGRSTSVCTLPSCKPICIWIRREMPAFMVAHGGAIGGTGAGKGCDGERRWQGDLERLACRSCRHYRRHVM